MYTFCLIGTFPQFRLIFECFVIFIHNVYNDDYLYINNELSFRIQPKRLSLK